MNSKSSKIAEWTKHLEGQGHDARYLGFFDCFNRQEYFEAHEVLEALWLPQRRSPNGNFFKGLIQLAGAFVHIQKGRRGPALALFRLAERHLHPYGPAHEGLNTPRVLGLIQQWMHQVEANPGVPTLAPDNFPLLHLDKTSESG